ncbi:MAG: hypothetical protein V1873_06075 [Verrucomicrobiota bacterium]
METKITFTSKINFNGQQYASPNDMPADVREVYEKAMASLAGPDGHSLINVQLKSTSKIVFNGKEYGGVDEMPPDVRQMYDRIMATVTAKPEERNDISGTIPAGARRAVLERTGVSAAEPTPRLRGFPARSSGMDFRRTLATVFNAIWVILLIGWLIWLVIRRTASHP